ncbi:hypothetical protein EJ05DRAFT_501678 [Pseudovirgaria hyperparasitica]|uniref:Uncharacterized protein n=1 Tax=Pseudovirgaria hyperparasitica TaxID=470096 RepID=A0A6A6W529_9PEZI|nr:uncharacterized protein EJ05DRAFT_501678 [Pseudovirgaria hyperparasitica]KAF2757144.1 hypothetical protein EJ05DRAFT_501678 [Pseudovirgaria hyperparasitica]
MANNSLSTARASEPKKPSLPTPPPRSPVRRAPMGTEPTITTSDGWVHITLRPAPITARPSRPMYDRVRDRRWHLQGSRVGQKSRGQEPQDNASEATTELDPEERREREEEGGSEEAEKERTVYGGEEKVVGDGEKEVRREMK